jgi:predicted nucleic acid-binding protein
MASVSYLLDTDILYRLATQKHPNGPLRVNDALIAATAWTKRLPLLTRNRKHYKFITEIALADLLVTAAHRSAELTTKPFG